MDCDVVTSKTAVVFVSVTVGVVVSTTGVTVTASSSVFVVDVLEGVDVVVGVVVNTPILNVASRFEAFALCPVAL